MSGANLRGAELIGTDLSDAMLAFAGLSGAKLADVDLNGSYFYRTNLSGTIFSFEKSTMAGGRSGNVAARDLTQSQLDKAVAHPDDPPILDGMTDAGTGATLEWRGGPL